MISVRVVDALKHTENWKKKLVKNKASTQERVEVWGGTRHPCGEGWDVREGVWSKGKNMLDISCSLSSLPWQDSWQLKEERLALAHSSEGTAHRGRGGLAAGLAWLASVESCGSCFLWGSDQKAESLGRRRGQDRPWEISLLQQCFIPHDVSTVSPKQSCQSFQTS